MDFLLVLLLILIANYFLLIIIIIILINYLGYLGHLVMENQVLLINYLGLVMESLVHLLLNINLTFAKDFEDSFMVVTIIKVKANVSLI